MTERVERMETKRNTNRKEKKEWKNYISSLKSSLTLKCIKNSTKIYLSQTICFYSNVTVLLTALQK